MNKINSVWSWVVSMIFLCCSSSPYWNTFFHLIIARQSEESCVTGVFLRREPGVAIVQTARHGRDGLTTAVCAFCEGASDQAETKRHKVLTCKASTCPHVPLWRCRILYVGSPRPDVSVSRIVVFIRIKTFGLYVTVWFLSQICRHSRFMQLNNVK